MTQWTMKGQLIGAIALTSIGLSLGLTLPVGAQDIDVPTPAEPDAPLDDETGSPDGGAPAGADDLPEGAGTLTDNIIIINGTAYEYDPADLEDNPILDNLSPVGDREINLDNSSDPGIGDESDAGGMVTYPPADSIEDLEPEDILGE